MFDHPFSMGEERVEEYRLKNKRLEAENAELKKQLVEKDKVIWELAGHMYWHLVLPGVSEEKIRRQRISAAEKAVKESEAFHDPKM